MPSPGEYKTVQSRILAYAQEIGWTYVAREEAERRRGFDHGGATPEPLAWRLSTSTICSTPRSWLSIRNIKRLKALWSASSDGSTPTLPVIVSSLPTCAIREKSFAPKRIGNWT